MNTTDTRSLTAHPKVRAIHQQRLAYVYVRQSSPKQVAHNLESQRLQYELAQRAEELGWRREQVRIIDEDQGLSGKESAGRDGFQDLVAEVSLGQVGIVFGYQVSRLARNNADWYHLLDLAAVFDTLMADADGVYNLRDYNDRLILGLKGTMSEAELHWLRQRLDDGRMSKVRRGEYHQGLPTGLVRLDDGTVVKHPDDQVRHALDLVFHKFEELGSWGRVMRDLHRADILLPRQQLSGPFQGQLLWKPATESAIYAIIKNPAYAGAFAYGRRRTDPTRRQPGKRSSGIVQCPMDEWQHLQQDVYPAYITWEQYLANQERLRQAATQFAQQTTRAAGNPRKGAALLQGLIVCGECGHRLRPGYKPRPFYMCCDLAKRTDGPHCLWLPATPVDEVVVQAFFDALRPAHIDALEAVLAEQYAERQRLTQLWEERLKRAQYDTHLAERQYNAVDPDNRLVAAELERRWETTLRQLQDTQVAYQHFLQTDRPPDIPADLRAQLAEISTALPDVWPALAYDQQKQLLRSLIARVICRKFAYDRVDIRIVWVSGHYSDHQAEVQVTDNTKVTGYEQMVERTEALWREGLNDTQIAAQLTQEGFRTARSTGVAPWAVYMIRLEHGWHLFLARSWHALELDGYLTALGLAEKLGVNREWVYRRLLNQTIDPKWVKRGPKDKVYLIQIDPELIGQLRQSLRGDACS
jgi:DNA invertase Pin-like site-specific DNA recombinase